MTIGGVQGGLIILNSTQKISKPNLKKPFKKISFKIFSNLDILHSIVLPISVLKQSLLSQYPSPKKGTSVQSFIPIGWCEFTPAWQNMKFKRHA